jgi:hypothetical protein
VKATGENLNIRLEALKTAIFESLKSAEAIDAFVTRYCRRRIDRLLKKIDLSDAKKVEDIAAEYRRQVAALDISAIAQKAKDRIETALRNNDLPTLLASYDNKSLVRLAAKHLKSSKLVDFESWLVRVLKGNKFPALTSAIRDSLPTLQPE